MNLLNRPRVYNGQLFRLRPIIVYRESGGKTECAAANIPVRNVKGHNMQIIYGNWKGSKLV